MAVERAAGGTSLIDVLDRVLDKGIVIDAWVRVSLVGIDLITVEARVVVASIDTYLKYSEAVGQVSPVSRPQAELDRAPERHRRERRAARGAGRRARARREELAQGAGRASGRSRGGAAEGITPCTGRRAGRAGCGRSSWKRSSRWPSFCWPAPTCRRPRAARSTGWSRTRRHRAGGRRCRRACQPISCCSSPSTASRAPRSSISSLTRDDEAHPLIAAMHRREPTYFDGSHVVVPVADRRARSTRSRCAPTTTRSAHGLLLRARRGPDAASRSDRGSAGLLAKQVARLLSRADARRDAVRPGADAALQHHQRGHRPDPAHRHRRQADHREHPRGEAVRRARGRERRLAARGRAEQHAVLGGALDQRRRRDRSWRAASCCWSIRSKARTCCSSCSARARRTSARAPTSSRSCATSPTWRARRKRSKRATARCAWRRRKSATSATGSN